MPEQKKFNTSQKKIREIDINPPVLYGKTDDGIKRLLPSSLITDSSKHNNQSITKGIYASSYKRIITLDSLSTNLKVYKLNSIFERIIVPQSQKDKEVIIMGLTYSEREQRIGATLKDVSLIFWDKQDQFKFQKNFSISAYVQDYQTNIWYLNNTQQWVTTDKSNAIIIWDLEHEKVKQQIISKEIQGSINEIIEITHIKLVAVSSLDKKVTVWNLEKVKFKQRKYLENIIFTIDLGHAGIHHMLYSYQYQCLITSGFENSINVFSINPQYLDYDVIGKLVGHSSMVTAIQIIEKTPMIVSADDMGNIKIWDIRSLKCLQTINIGCKTTMTHIINVPDKNMICLLGTRVNFISFDISHVQRQSEDVYPIKMIQKKGQLRYLVFMNFYEVEFNMIKQEMAICTRKDMRFLRMKDGKITKIYSGLLQNQDDEIATFSSINQFKNFILGDHRGCLGLYSYNNGEKIKDLIGHQSEISQLKIDFPNKLIISSSWDSNIILQRETNQGTEIKRIIKNAHHKKEVNQMEISLYHNVIITGSSEKKIYVWDYEFVKLIACIEIDKGTEPTGFTIINGYRILLISTNSGMIYILKFNIKEFKAQFELIGAFNLSNFIKNENEIEKKNEDLQQLQTAQSDEFDENKSEIHSPRNKQFRKESSANTSTINSNTNNQNPLNIRSSIQMNPSHVIGTSQANLNQGYSKQQNQDQKNKKKNQQIKASVPPIKVGFTIQNSEKQSSSQTPQNQQNANPYIQKSQFRSTNDSQYFAEANKRKSSPSQGVNFDQSNDSSFYEEQLPVEWPTKLLTEIEVNEESKVLKSCLLYAATNKGNIFAFNINSFIQQEEIQLSDHSTQRLNYNPLRQCSEDFNSQIEQISKESVKIPQLIQSNKKLLTKTEKQVEKVRQFAAHKDNLTSFQFIELNNKCILTSSQDQYIRIWTLNGELIGNLNINHPLPVQWSMQFDHHEKVKKKVFYALKILDIMLSKYKADSNLRKVMQIDNFINNLLPPQRQDIQLNFSQVKEQHEQNLQNQSKGVIFMKDEYSPRDIKFNDIKQLFEKELRGISLKQMEANKRLSLAQQDAIELYQAPEIDIHAKRRKHEEQEMLMFLAPSYRNRIIQKQFENDYTKNVYLLGKKLDQKLREKQRQQAKARFSMLNQQADNVSVEESQSQTQRNSQLSYHLLNTPGKIMKEEQRKSTSKQTNKPQLSPKKQDDQSRQSKQDIFSNQFISIVEKEDTPKLKKKESKGSRINLQFNFENQNSKSNSIEPQHQQQQQQKKSEKQVQKRKNKSQYKSLDYLEYASEKNYLDESILQLSAVIPLNSSQNINKTNIIQTKNNIISSPQAKQDLINNSTQAANNSVIGNNSIAGNTSAVGNISVVGNSSNINQQSSIISKNGINSTTILATDRSIISYNNVSANNLQKAKVQLFMKNINSKLRQSRYQADKVILEKFEKQNLSKKQPENQEQENILIDQQDKNFLNSIVNESLLDGGKDDSVLNEIEFKLSTISQPLQQLSHSILKPIQIQLAQKSILDTLREENFHKGSLTDRPSKSDSIKKFDLKLPQIQQAVTYRAESVSRIPSTIRSARQKQQL